MISSFPKIFAIGNARINEIFFDEVEVTEKIDGSQFVFGKINGELHFRSKRAILYKENPQKMFREGIEYISSKKDLLPNGIVFYSEYLQKPKHNVLVYNRVPKNNIALFGAIDYTKQTMLSDYWKYADQLEIDRVPILHIGKVNKIEELHGLLDKESILGGPKIEGIVVKNYKKELFVGDIFLPLLSGKYVSEKFKEVHNKDWKKNNCTKGRFELFKESFRTEARWEKAIQHLREKDELENDPRDIGKLLKEIQNDIEVEEKENIKEYLYNEFKREIMSTAIKGFPIWYKNKLLESVEFNGEE